MLVSGQTTIRKWKKSNREWYEGKGYEFTNYGDEFILDVNDLTKGAKEIVKVQCDYCGKIHNTVWRDYYVRKDYGKYACKECRLKKASETTLESRRLNLYNRAKDFCNKYDYQIITPIEEIFNADSRINYICPKHGIHNVKIYNLITGHRCIDCMHELGGENQKLDINEIINYIEEHGSKLLNPQDYTKSTDKNLFVICPDCGEKFLTSFYSFQKHNGQKCPDCTNIESKGEHEVRKYLEANNIDFNPQHRFYDCRTTVPLPFDFYIPKMNIAIEYDGEGHYMPIKRGSMTQKDAEYNLKQTQKRDDIKTNYCKNNGIILIRIPYFDFDNIPNILDRKIKNLHEDIV